MLYDAEKWDGQPQNAPFRGRLSTPSNTWFLGPTRITYPNGITIGSGVFCTAHKRDQQTDTQTTLLRL